MTIAIILGIAAYQIIFHVLGLFDCAAPKAHIMEAGVAVEIVLLTYLVAHGVHQDINSYDLVKLTDA